MIDKSSNPCIDLLLDSNFQVSPPLNTYELWFHPQFHFRGNISHLIISGSCVLVTLFQYAFLTILFINSRFILPYFTIFYLSIAHIIQSRRIKCTIFLQFTKTLVQRKRPFGENSKNFQKAVILPNYKILRERSVAT